jgi:hypothetical protein
MRPSDGDRRGYFRSVARAVGVPDFWLDDAVQDIAFAAWRDGKLNDPLAIRRRAIDAARRYGAMGRRGRRRPPVLPLEVAEDVATLPVQQIETQQAIASWWTALTPRQRRAIQRRLDRRPMSNRDSASASSARRRLRDELSA